MSQASFHIQWKFFYHFFNSCLTMYVVLKVCSAYSHQHISIVPAAAVILVGSSALMMLASENTGENGDDMASNRVYACAAHREARNGCLLTRSSTTLPLYNGKGYQGGWIRWKE
jgi:hypothetical protein